MNIPHPVTCGHRSWWRHQMAIFSALLAICAGNSPVPVNSPHKGQWRGALMFSLICVWINGWVNNREAGDLRRNRAHCDVIVMLIGQSPSVDSVSRVSRAGGLYVAVATQDCWICMTSQTSRVCKYCFSVLPIDKTSSVLAQIVLSWGTAFAHPATGCGINAKDPSGLDSDR